VGCGTALGKKFIKAIFLGNPRDKCGMGNTLTRKNEIETEKGQTN